MTFNERVPGSSRELSYQRCMVDGRRQVQPFLDLVQRIYGNLPKAMENAFDKPAPQPARVRSLLSVAPAAGRGDLTTRPCPCCAVFNGLRYSPDPCRARWQRSRRAHPRRRRTHRARPRRLPARRRAKCAPSNAACTRSRCSRSAPSSSFCSSSCTAPSTRHTSSHSCLSYSRCAVPMSACAA